MSCVTAFEAFYPFFSFVFIVLGLATYQVLRAAVRPAHVCLSVVVFVMQGYYSVPLHPGQFRYLRLKFRMKTLSITWTSLETGIRRKMPLLVSVTLVWRTGVRHVVLLFRPCCVRISLFLPLRCQNPRWTLSARR